MLSITFFTAYVSIRTVPQSIYGQTRGKKNRPWVRYGSQAVQQLGCELRCEFGQCAAGGLVAACQLLFFFFSRLAVNALLVSCCLFALLRVCSSRHMDLFACSYGRSACVRAVFHLFLCAAARISLASSSSCRGSSLLSAVFARVSLCPARPGFVAH